MGGMTDARQTRTKGKREKPKGVGRRLRENVLFGGRQQNTENSVGVGFIQMELPNHDDQERKNGKVVSGLHSFGVGRIIFFVSGLVRSSRSFPRVPPLPNWHGRDRDHHPAIFMYCIIPLPALWSHSFQKHSSIVVSLLLFPLAFTE